MRATSSTGTCPSYVSGFGNDFEALPDDLPQGRNSPQRVNYGLYAEQLSGPPSAALLSRQERSWMCRMRPSDKNVDRFQKVDMPYWKTAPQIVEDVIPPGQ